jgi:hypothetical protein
VGKEKFTKETRRACSFTEKKGDGRKAAGGDRV